MTRIRQSDGAAKGHPRTPADVYGTRADGAGSAVLNEAQLIQRQIKTTPTQPSYLGVVATPTMLTPLAGGPAAGPLGLNARVKLGAPVAGVTLRYTLDGADPTDASPAVTGQLVTISQTPCTLKVRGFRPQYQPSAVFSRAYTVPTQIGESWYWCQAAVRSQQKLLVLPDNTVIGVNGSGQYYDAFKAADYGRAASSYLGYDFTYDAVINGGRLFILRNGYIDVFDSPTHASVGYGLHSSSVNLPTAAEGRRLAFGPTVAVIAGYNGKVSATPVASAATSWPALGLGNSTFAVAGGNATPRAFMYSEIAGKFLCGMSNGRLVSSVDGETWVLEFNAGATFEVSAIAEGDGKIVVGLRYLSGGVNPSPRVSTDGVTWNTVTNLLNGYSPNVNGIAYTSGAFWFSCGSDLRKSTDLVTSVSVSTPITSLLGTGSALTLGNDGRLITARSGSAEIWQSSI